jgi:hypothetical protein
VLQVPEIGHVWVNCRHPPVVCGVGAVPCITHAHRRAMQHQYCCNMLQLQIGGRRETKSLIYRGCSHSREEMRKRKSPRAPKTTMGGVFSSSHTTLEVSFAAALRSNTQQQQPQPPPVAQACPGTRKKWLPPLLRHNQQVPSQFRLLMHTVRLERHVQSSCNGISEDNDRGQ